MSSVGSLVSIFGVVVFFVVVYDLLRNFGFFAESGSFFVLVPYSKLIKSLPSFFSSYLKRSVYFFPKYRFLNIIDNHNLIINKYSVYFSFFSWWPFFSVVFKYLRVFKHFWFYCFIFNFISLKKFRKFLVFNFKFVLFSKTFSNVSSRNFFFFFKLISKRYLESIFSLPFVYLRYFDKLIRIDIFTKFCDIVNGFSKKKKKS